MSRVWKEQRGSQIVEFALIFPILLYLVLSVPILGMAVRAWLVAEGAAREGARVLAIRKNRTEAVQKAYAEVTQMGRLPTVDASGNSLFTANDITVTLTPDSAEVTVTYRQPTYVPGLGRLLNGGGTDRYFTVRGRARFLPEGR